MTQTVKMNELFSPAALASQVLFQLAKILLSILPFMSYKIRFPAMQFYHAVYCLGKSFELKLVYFKRGLIDHRLINFKSF